MKCNHLVLTKTNTLYVNYISQKLHIFMFINPETVHGRSNLIPSFGALSDRSVFCVENRDFLGFLGIF